MKVAIGYRTINNPWGGGNQFAKSLSKYLLDKGMQQGVLIGKTLKKIEEEWIDNNFKISQERVQEIIRLNSN